MSWNSYLYANSNPLFYIDKQGYYSVGELVGDWWVGTQRVWGGLAGAGVAVAKTAYATAELVSDSMAPGTPQAMERNHARAQAIIGAVKDPTAAMDSGFASLDRSLDRAEQLRREGNHFGAATIHGELGGDVGMVLDAGLGLAKGGASLAGRGAEAFSQMRKGASNAAEIRALTDAEQAAVVGGSTTRTRPNVSETTPVTVTERQSGPGVKGRVDDVGSGAAAEISQDNVARAPSSAAGARYVYDGSTGQYRDLTTGRFVAQRDLPYPSNRGFESSVRGTLAEGKTIGRFGPETGRYVGEPGATVSELGLPAGSEALPYSRYSVVKPFDAEIGPAAAVPEFGAAGGGTQFRFDVPVGELVKRGYLKRLP